MFKTIVFLFVAFLLSLNSLVLADDAGVEDVSHVSYLFDIENQALGDALVVLGEQSNYSIVFSSMLVRRVNSSPVVGRYRVESALQLLLSKSGLAFRVDYRGRAIYITQRKNHEIARESLRKQSGPKEEVQIVTARHRDENIIDVPMSISSVGGDLVERVGMQDLIQFGDYVSNTTLRAIRGTNSNLAIYIRGVGHDDPVAGLESSVGVYIDDVYFGRPQGIALDVYDVERIEVLRGPQGTLYGRNTIGGAVKYITKRIGDDPLLRVRGALGSFSQRDIAVTAGLPATREIKVGGSIASFRRDGFGVNRTTGEQHYNKDVLTYRGSLEWTPHDDVLVRLAFDKTDDRSAPRSGYLINESLEVPKLEHEFDTRSGSAFVGHPISKNNISIKGGAASIEWSVNDYWRLKYIGAKRYDRSEGMSDIDSILLVIADGFSLYENEQLSHELRLSHDSDVYDFLFGMYYLDATGESTFDIAGERIVTPLFIEPIKAVLGTFNRVTVHSYSAFSSLSLALNQFFSLGLGVRYTVEQRELTAIRNYYTETSSGNLVSPFFGGDGRSIFPVSEYRDENGVVVWPSFLGKREDDAYTPRVSLSWQPNEDLHVYGLYSMGFKSGGYAPRGIFTDADLRRGFKPEKIKAYEVGIKSIAWDSLVQTHFNVFHSDYENMQLVETAIVDINADGVVDIPIPVVMNAQAATVKGAELSLILEPSSGWQSNLAIGLVDAEFDRFLTSAGFDLANDRAFVSTPEITISFGQQYRMTTAIGELQLSGSVHYQSETTFFHAPSEPVDQSGYSIFNSSINWVPKGGRWSLNLSALNLTDRRYRVGAFYQLGLSDQLPNGDLMTVFYGSPRTVSLAVGYSF